MAGMLRFGLLRRSKHIFFLSSFCGSYTDTDTVIITMTKTTTIIPISDIILDEEIYPRSGVDQKRVGIFAENIRDGF